MTGIWRWALGTVVFLNIMVILLGKAHMINWWATGFCVLTYFAISQLEIYTRNLDAEVHKTADDVFNMVLLINFFDGVASAGWASYCETKGYIKNKPCLEFAQEAYSYAPDYIKDRSNKNNKLYFEMWPSA